MYDLSGLRFPGDAPPGSNPLSPRPTCGAQVNVPRIKRYEMVFLGLILWRGLSLTHMGVGIPLRGEAYPPEATKRCELLLGSTSSLRIYNSASLISTTPELPVVPPSTMISKLEHELFGLLADARTTNSLALAALTIVVYFGFNWDANIELTTPSRLEHIANFGDEVN
ncbi:hypothetical protein FB451DRAFT_1181127 [Mycena latifolia]|nr:hypothetical protein FB451DRAFT_1181127 [Mycena latifolia]